MNNKTKLALMLATLIALPACSYESKSSNKSRSITEDGAGSGTADGPLSCGYNFSDETNPAEAEAFWRSIAGAWRTGGFWTIEQDENGNKIYRKSGFEVDLSSGKFGFIAIYNEEVTGEHNFFYTRRTHADHPIEGIRLSRPLTTGNWAGARFVESYDAERATCSTILIQPGQELMVRGVIRTSGGGRRDYHEVPESDSFGAYLFMRLE